MARADHEAAIVPRIRTIKPEILEDEKVSRLSDTAYRLFTSMIVLADDHGRVRADTRWLQAQIWWAHHPPPNVISALRELWQAGLVDVYAVRGGTYAALMGWAKHQRVDNAGKGKVPAPDDRDATDVDEDFLPMPGSRRISANRGEIPLDQEGDQEEEWEGDPPRAAALPPPCLSPSPPGSAARFVLRQAERKLAEKLELNAEAEAEAFRDYYVSKGSQIADVNAAFRGWLRRAKKFAARPSVHVNGKGEAREIPDL